VIDDLLKRLDVNKEMFVAVPVLGTALSITYDVGYFYGVDINYFTMFSLLDCCRTFYAVDHRKKATERSERCAELG